MNTHQVLRAVVIGLATGLSACGGGGGDPGQCFGSPEVCLDGGNPNIGESPTTVGSVQPSTPSNNTGTTTTTGATTTSTGN